MLQFLTENKHVHHDYIFANDVSMRGKFRMNVGKQYEHEIGEERKKTKEQSSAECITLSENSTRVQCVN